MTTSIHALGSRSLLSISATAFLAAITHAYDFGVPALVAGGILIALMALLNGHYRRTGKRIPLLLYGLLNLWIIVGLGLVGGFWNHTVKVALAATYRGAIPASVENLFMSPELGSVVFEGLGVLTFVACVVAAYFGYHYGRAVLTRPKAGVRVSSGADPI